MFEKQTKKQLERVHVFEVANCKRRDDRNDDVNIATSARKRMLVALWIDSPVC
jgi:hypothetical protein